MADPGDLLLTFGSGTPSNGGAIQAQGWSLAHVVGAGPLTGFLAARQSDGTDPALLISWPSTASWAAWLVEMNGNLPGGHSPWPHIVAHEGDGSADVVTFEGVTALGDAQVWAFALTDRAFTGTLATPSGYTLERVESFATGPFGAGGLWRRDIGAGAHTPEASSAVDGDYLTMTVIVHERNANVLPPLSCSMSVGAVVAPTPADDGIPPDPGHTPEALPPERPEPTPIVVPVPPWPNRGI